MLEICSVIPICSWVYVSGSRICISWRGMIDMGT
jgi:hypothetical protein